jgi:hypothetical protein
MNQRLKQVAIGLTILGITLAASTSKAQTNLPAYNQVKYQQLLRSQQAFAQRACSNYLNARNRSGQLTKAKYNGDGSVGCDTRSDCFGIPRDQAIQWASRG